MPRTVLEVNQSLFQKKEIGPFIEFDEKLTPKRKDGTPGGGEKIPGSGQVWTLDHLTGIFDTLFGSPTRAVVTVVGSTAAIVAILTKAGVDPDRIAEFVADMMLQFGDMIAVFSIALFTGLFDAFGNWASGIASIAKDAVQDGSDKVKSSTRNFLTNFSALVAGIARGGLAT